MSSSEKWKTKTPNLWASIDQFYNNLRLIAHFVKATIHIHIHDSCVRCGVPVLAPLSLYYPIALSPYHRSDTSHRIIAAKDERCCLALLRRSYSFNYCLDRPHGGTAVLQLIDGLRRSKFDCLCDTADKFRDSIASLLWIYLPPFPTSKTSSSSAQG